MTAKHLTLEIPELGDNLERLFSERERPISLGATKNHDGGSHSDKDIRPRDYFRNYGIGSAPAACRHSVIAELDSGRMIRQCQSRPRRPASCTAEGPEDTPSLR